MTPKSKPFANLRPIILAALAVCLVYLWAGPGAAAAQAVSPAVEQAVLAENWAQVLDLLKEVNPQTPSPVLRLIKGHACLAMNRNNESLCLFLSVSANNEQEAWLAWAKDFAVRHPQNAAVLYLHGDALARLDQPDEAINVFNLAAAKNGNHALSLNARGVIYASKREWNKALIDFDKAAKAKGNLADAYCNQGELSIQQQDGAPGALEAFQRALKLSPDFAVALFGQGCIKVVLRKWDEAMKDMDLVSARGGCAKDLIAANFAKMLAIIDAGIKRDMELAKARGENPQTRIDAYLEDIKKNGAGWIGGPLNKMVKETNQYNDPKAKQYMADGLAKIMTDPKVSEKVKTGIMNQSGEIVRWNNLVEKNITSSPQITGMKQEIEGKIKVGGQAGVGVAGVGSVQVPLPEVIGGAKTSKDIKPGQNKDLNEARANRDLGKMIETKVQQAAPDIKTKVQGFKTSLDEAAMDEGNWPFSPIYGLFYQKGI